MYDTSVQLYQTDIDRVFKVFSLSISSGLSDISMSNKFIVETLNKKIKIEPNKSPVVLDSFGNTGSCSIPLVITEKMVNSKKCFMSSFGVGLSYANCFVDLSSSKILKTKYSKNG